MLHRPSPAAALVASVAIHVVLGVGLYLAPSMAPPIQINYEFDVVKGQRDFLPPDEPDEPPPAPAPRKKKKPHPGKDPGGAGEDGGADDADGGASDGGVPDGGPGDGGVLDGGRGLPAATKDLRKAAPGGARVIVLLRNDLVRASPYREATVGLLRALPDWRTLVGDSDFDPVGEIDALLVATPNPYDVTATFLAARVKDEAHARREIKPRTHPSDPRKLAWAGPNVAVFASKEQQEHIGGAWVRHLSRFEGRGPSAAALQLNLQDLKGLMELTGGKIIRIPKLVELSMTTTVPSVVRVRLTYEDDQQAEKVREAWPWIVDKLKAYPPVQLFGLATLTDSLTPRREGNIVYVEGNVSKQHIEAILTLARMALLHQLGN